MNNKPIQNFYILNGEYKIIEVHPEWDNFAKENFATSDTLKNKIIGKKIMDFIKGDPVRMWYETIISYAKSLNIRVKRPYRCDSPNKKRYMEMEVIPMKDGKIKVNHYLIKEEEVKNPIETFKFSLEMDKNSSLRCSSCNRFLHLNRWIELEEAVKIHDFRSIFVVDIICNECLKQKIDEM